MSEEDSKLKDLKVLEVFAFYLCATVQGAAKDAEEGQKMIAALRQQFSPSKREAVLENMRLLWQGNAEDRAQFRKLAADVVAGLESDGLTLRSCDARRVDKSVDWIRTVPEKKAYDWAEAKSTSPWNSPPPPPPPAMPSK